MNWRLLIVLAVQALLLGCVLLLSVWVKLPWYVLVELAAAGALACWNTRVAGRGETGRRWRVTAVWISTLLVPLSVACSRSRPGILEGYFVLITWAMATLTLLSAVPQALAGLGWPQKALRPAPARPGASDRAPAETGLPVMACERRCSSGCSGPGLAWAFFGCFIWLAAAYTQDLRGGFLACLAVLLALLVVTRLWCHLPAAAVVGVHTLILLAVALPSFDLFWRPSYRLEPSPDLAARLYSYAEAKQNPEAFARWWRYFGRQWQLLARNLYVFQNTAPLPYRFRPNSEYEFFQSRVRINSLGFRGRDIARDKGNAYRILALGESTTFGCTLAPEDRPWPEVLEQLIRERLHPPGPVEVINAGVPGWSLEDNLHRLATDILPLKPDLMISYHGINGFHLLDRSIPRPTGPAPPEYRLRPLKILADAEYGVRMLWYRRAVAAPQPQPRPRPSDPLASRAAQAYTQLIDCARTNGIRLALGTFCLAVNAASERDVIKFYRPAFPQVYAQIAANEVNTRLVKELAARRPEVIYVDTQPHLDGEHEKFIDLAHLTQPGREQLAETIFAALRETLAADLSRTNAVGPNSSQAVGASSGHEVRGEGD